MYCDTQLIGPDTDLEQFVSELKMPWKTMDSDMDTALKIITNHAKTEMDLEGLPLVSITAAGEALHIDFPDWQEDIEKTFIHQYGLREGRMIFNKVMMRLYLMSKGDAQPLH
jgi:hypothetical protein